MSISPHHMRASVLMSGSDISSELSEPTYVAPSHVYLITEDTTSSNFLRSRKHVVYESKAMALQDAEAKATKHVGARGLIQTSYEKPHVLRGWHTEDLEGRKSAVRVERVLFVAAPGVPQVVEPESEGSRMSDAEVVDRLVHLGAQL